MRATGTASLCIALVSTASIYGAEAAYLGGTVKSIPAETTGTLDLSDPNDLIFSYPKGIYRLPFEQIKSFQWERAKPEGKRLLGHVPVPRLPHLPWGKDEDVLNLSFRAHENSTGVLSFRVSGKDRPATGWALESRIEEPKSAPRTTGVRLTQSWWGDRYWKTNRNAAAWPASESETAGTH